MLFYRHPILVYRTSFCRHIVYLPPDSTIVGYCRTKYMLKVCLWCDVVVMMRHNKWQTARSTIENGYKLL